MSAPALLPAPEVHLRPHCRPASQSFGGAVPAASPARPHARPARGREPDGLSLERIASSSRGGSLVLPPRPGWRDLAGRCWHARPPAARAPPTNSVPEPSTLGSLIDGRLRWLQRLPLVAWRHTTVSTIPRFQGQGRPPGQAFRRGCIMTEASVSFAGNLTNQPEVRYTESGIAKAIIRVAVSGRREQEPSFFTVVVWRDQAEHASQSLSKGSRVVIVGRLQQRSWTAEDGSARSLVEVVAEEAGPSLRWATATPVRATRSASV